MSALALSIESLEPVRRGRGEWAGLSTAFLVALSLHAGALAFVALWRSAAPVSPPGEQQVTVDLAPQMVEAASVAPVETSVPFGIPAEAPPVDAPFEVAAAAPAEPPVDTVPPPPAALAEAEPAPEVPPPPAEEVAPVTSTAVDPAAIPAVTAAVPPPDAVPARPLPEPRRAPVQKPAERRPPPKPVREPVERERPRPVQQAARPGAAGESRRDAARGASSREDAGGSAAASADPSALSRYAAQIASALKARLRYPEAARAVGAGGVATLRFTVHRSGRVVSASLVRSAGHPALDAAALATAAPGSALPAAPDAVPQAQLTFSVPLRFDTR